MNPPVMKDSSLENLDLIITFSDLHFKFTFSVTGGYFSVYIFGTSGGKYCTFHYFFRLVFLATEKRLHVKQKYSNAHKLWPTYSSL